MAVRKFELLVNRVKGEFVEMPGLSLTIDQGARLWGLERQECETLLHTLVRREFLTVRGDGKYGRATDAIARDIPLRAAKASLPPDTSSAPSGGTPADRRAGGRS